MDSFRLKPAAAAQLKALIATTAEEVIAEIIREVPAYSEPFRGQMGRNIERAVDLALNGFVDSVTEDAPTDVPVDDVLAAAWELGRGEARSGRSMDALAAAYRIGTARAWHDMSEGLVETGISGADLARFAALVFEYLDQLSARSVAGHAAWLAETGQRLERSRQALARALLEGQSVEALETAAHEADWEPPDHLVVVVVPAASASAARTRLDSRTLELPGVAVAEDDSRSVLIVPATPSGRDALLAALTDLTAVVGPIRPWADVSRSWQRAQRAVAIGLDSGLVDTDAHLSDLVRQADADAISDLRAQVMAPLADLRPAAREKLTATLRAWLRHQGRREPMAAELFVHPQTVRYRVGQLREHFGARLDDPEFVVAATTALG